MGKLFKWLFIIFNVVMLAWMLFACSTAGDVINGASSDAERAGGAIGATLATGMLLTVWAAGVVILGAFMLFTPGTKVVIEETVE